MKTYNTIVVGLILALNISPILAQKPSQELITAYQIEMDEFSHFISNLNDGYVDAYNNLSLTLRKGELKIQKSNRNYPKLVPAWFDKALGQSSLVAGPAAPIATTLGKGATYLLELGWKERNEELERKRKAYLLKEQINVKEWVLYNLNEFQIKMDPFISPGREPSKFETLVNATFYKNRTEAMQILEYMNEINNSLYNSNPIFAEKNKIKAKSIAKQKLYQEYVNHFTTYLHNSERLNDLIQEHHGGYLAAYVKFDDEFNIVDRILVLNVPSGHDIGYELNDLLPNLDREPFDLKVIKVVYINSSYLDKFGKKVRDIWRINLGENNEIPESLQKSRYDGTKEFLANYGEVNYEGQWKIKKSFFNKFSKFTEGVPNGSKLPFYMKEMFE